MKSLRASVRDWMPPVLTRLVGRKLNRCGWSGDYASWEKAEAESLGYDSNFILEKVKASLLRVKEGKAAYERDSVLFDEIEYSWPLLAGLMWAASQSSEGLNLIDFGGSLGSTYFQNRKFLAGLSAVNWNVVEQKHFVAAGIEHFSDRHLHFFCDVESCLSQHSPNTVLFSGVIQYLKDTYELLRQIKLIGFEFVIFDRTLFVDSHSDILTVQRVPATIYGGSYPCWFFNIDRLRLFFEDRYELVAEFDSRGGCIALDGGRSGNDKGLIFRIRGTS